MVVADALAISEQAGDLETLRHLRDLADGAQVEQEVVDLVLGIQRGQDGKQVVDELGSEFV